MRHFLKSQTLLSAASVALVASLGTAAYAQDAEETATDDQIVVTGSRIPQPNLASSSPVTQVTSAEFKFRGVTRVEDLLNDLPQVLATNTSGDANGATGTATVDLRGLGEIRTLVLQNGRRLPIGSPGAGGYAPDLNFIPGLLVERVEVLTGGASAAYGSDAIAGVVNFIMTDNFEGVRVDYQYSGYQHNNNNSEIQNVVDGEGFPFPTGSTFGGEQHEFNIVMGANTPDGRGNVTGYASYRNVDAVLQSERDYSACALTGRAGSFGCGGSSTVPEGRFTDFGLATAAPGTFPDLIGGPPDPITGDPTPDGNQDIPGFDFTIDQTTGDFVPFSTLYNYGPLNYYQRPDERITAGAFANYEINRHAEVYMEVGFMDDRTVAQIAPSGAFFVTSSLNCSNPFLSTQQFDAICGDYGLTTADSQNVFIGRRNVEGGPRQSDLRHTTWRGVFGVRGEINDIWSYDMFLNYGENSFSTVYRNDLSITAIGRALNVVADPVSGDPVCQSVLDGSDPSCVPWNIFTPGGQDVSQAALNYLVRPLFARGGTEQTNFVAFVNGDLGAYGFSSPMAEDGVQALIGYEYREEFLDFEPDFGFLTGDGAGQGGPTNPATGRLTVSEIFTEVKAPLIQGAPLAEDVTLELGYRYSDYEQTGIQTDTYKFALSWVTSPDLKIRASYQRAVRHANIRELFRPSGIGLFDLDEITISDNGTPDDASDDITAFDPCAGPTPAATAAQCANTGVTAAQYGSVADSPAGQFNAIFGGNPDLDPEESDTISVGAVFTPSAIPNLAFSIDWFNIDVQKAIGPIDPATILDQCLTTGDPTFCGYINRGVTGNGTLWLGQDNIVATDQNLGFIETSGIDFNATYSMDTPIGGLSYSWNAAYLLSYDQQQFPGAAVEACEGTYSSACGQPRPEWTSNASVRWSTPVNADVNLTWRYLGGVEGPDNFDAINYFDLAAIYPVNETFTLRAGINNLLDEEPPLTSSAGPSIFGNGNTFPGVYDALGRYLFFGVTAEF